MNKLIIATLLPLALTSNAAAYETQIDIKINDTYIKTISEPTIVGGSTFAPIRAICNAFGIDEIKWDNMKKSAEFSYQNKEIQLFNGKPYFIIDGEKIETPTPFISNDYLYIPVRAISEIFESDVKWDDEYKNVEIENCDLELNSNSIDDEFSDEDLYWMSRIISAESKGECFEGQVAVGDVIMNRVSSPDYPNSVYEVIFDTKYSVQFEPVANGSIFENPTPSSVAAAKVSMTSPTTVDNCLYFFNPEIASSNWISKNRTYYTAIGKHNFYL